jgi:hypothetical protein
MGLVRDYGGDNLRQTVEGARKAWRRNFNGSALDPDVWEIKSKGAGQTITVAAGQLQVNQGIGINEETVIRSIARFQIPLRVQFSMLISQRIAQNEIYLELVNAAGDTYTGWMFDGIVATTGKTVHMNGGNSQPASPTAGVTITSTAGSTLREIEARIDSVEFLDRGVDSNATGTHRAMKTRTTLDPYEDYYIQLRFKNTGGIAPATGTITTIETILVQDTNDVLVELSSGRAQGSVGKSIPVIVNNQATVMNNSASSSTSVGALTANRKADLTNVSHSVKAAQGKVMGYTVSNWGASAAWFNMYNSTAPIIGTTVPIIQVLIPPGGNADLPIDAFGVNFSTGITCAATDTSAVMSAIAPATPLVAVVFYV